MGHSGSGGVSVRAGASPNLGGRRAKLRQAQRRALVRSTYKHHDEDVSEVLCALVCGRCGQLAWPERTRAQAPHRRDDVAELGKQPACTHCGDKSWIDLRRESTALALRDGERQEREANDSRTREVVLNSTVGGALGLFMGVIVVGMTWPAAAVGLGVATLAGLVKYREYSHGDPNPRNLPRRWMMALPPKGAPVSQRTGTATAKEEPLRAPLSGTRCVAWEIGLREDDDDDDDLDTWALLEQQLDALEVDDEPVEPLLTHLGGKRRLLGRLSALPLDDAAKAYLRQRGIASSAPDYYVYETLVEVDARVQLDVYEAGFVLRAAPTALAQRERVLDVAEQ